MKRLGNDSTHNNTNREKMSTINADREQKYLNG